MRSILLMVAFFSFAAPAAAQTVDARWEPWFGCWQLAVEEVRDPASYDGLIPRASRPSSVRNNAPSVCVTPGSNGGARFETTIGTQTVVDETMVADGTMRPVPGGECTGRQKSQWSANGLRLYSSAELQCEGDDAARNVSGLSMLTPNGQWIDIQGVTIGARHSVRVKRYRRVGGAADAVANAAARPISLDELKDMSARLPAGVIEAALVETNAGQNLSARRLIELDEAGVPARVIDLLVALSYPDKFVVERRTGRGSYSDDPFMLGWALGYPYYYEGGFYSPYSYAPFVYRARGYDVIVDDGVIAGGGGIQTMRSGTGRAVDGLGYTRVVPRDTTTVTSPTSASTGRRGSAFEPPSRGSDSAPAPSTSSTSSSSGSSGSSSSGSSEGSSGGGSGASSGGDSGGRTAVPR